MILTNKFRHQIEHTIRKGYAVYQIYDTPHFEIQNNLSKFIEKEINPYVDEWEAQKMYPAKKIMKELGKLGILGPNKETEYGGLGLDFSYNLAIAETLGTINCGAIPMSIGAHAEITTVALSNYGSHELKTEFLKPTITGESIACLGVSEVEGGSDVAKIRTFAKIDGDDFIINGGKMWTTNGAQADWMCLLANTDTERPIHLNKSLFCVPMNTPGLSVNKKIDKLGMHSSDTAQIFLDNVRIPRSYLIGELNQGFVYQMKQFQEERLWLVASTLKRLDMIIQDTIDYCRNRNAFGKPILHNQTIHYNLAELQCEVEALRSLCHRCIAQYVHEKEDVTMLASMAKLKAGRLARKITDTCLQYYGGMGFTSEMLISRFYRDFRLLSIGGGADEVMLSIICKYMKTLPA